ncbi:hypothetical protein LTR37_002232 [Vermiconidia calcicola]|uniref:Uncharacterized protein n=1 Tax=Vermiconidia calcicola TaxID=1690605 RepID=A0ACC3NT44_9PEZI|nr:hypothetical protein LTR37_002232 [Vermiconidia calcicola]
MDLVDSVAGITALQQNQLDETITRPPSLALLPPDGLRCTPVKLEPRERYALTEHRNEYKMLERRRSASRRPRVQKSTLLTQYVTRRRVNQRSKAYYHLRKRVFKLVPRRPRPLRRAKKALTGLRNPRDNWFFQFAKIKLRYDDKIDSNGFGQTRLPTLDVRASEWVEDIVEQLDNGTTGQSARSICLPSAANQSHVWEQVALWLLAYDRTRMLQFLLATHSEPFVQARHIGGSLTQLSAHFLRLDELKRHAQMQDLADAFCIVAARKDGEELSFTSPFIRYLIPYCRDDQVQRIFQVIKEHKVKIRSFTYLHLATYFANNNHLQQGLEALVEASNVGDLHVNGWAFLCGCSTLLRKSIEQPDGLRETLRIVSTIADMGVRLDNPICDIIMLNAVEAGDLKTAFDVYHSLMERGLRPTESTFSVLLKGCRMNIDDAEMLNNVIRDAISNINVRQSELVSNQILHCLALHHSKHHPDTALNTLTEAYAQLFDLTPLRKLALPIPNIAQQRMTDDKLMTPTSHALGVMIGASINHMFAHDANLKHIFMLYERWRELVDAGEPSLAKLATTDHVANTFLSAFIRKPSGLIHAARVVKDMQRMLPPSAGVEQCKPSTQTWSIFLHGFTRHGQNKLAEQVLNYMRSKDIEPSQIAWNTLITGYARAQDVEGTIDVVRRADQAGMVWDAWTHSGLKALRNKDRLMEELRKERLRRNLDFTGELKSGLEERLSGEVGDFADSTGELAEGGGSQYRPFR